MRFPPAGYVDLEDALSPDELAAFHHLWETDPEFRADMQAHGVIVTYGDGPIITVEPAED